MGSTISSILSSLFIKKEIKIVMVGLDRGGKTTILYKLKLNKIVPTIPTIGFNLETVEYKNISLKFWDLFDQNRGRPLWRHFFDDCQSLIFVVDSTDRERIAEAEYELGVLWRSDKLKDKPFLVFANKQDLPNAMSKAELTNKLGLDSLSGRQWHIQETCALHGRGLYEGLDWLINELDKK